jgi:cobalt-zinc-cadmium efflux system outer membrane protein
VIRPAGITRLAAIGATTAVLWLSPAAAGDQPLPGATLGAKYVQRTGTEDTGEFVAKLNVPLHYDVKDAEPQAASARLGAAQALNETLRLRIYGQIADAWFGVDALRKVVQIYASRQLPPAHSSVDNARNGFQAGSSDISLVFESERRLRPVQLDLLKLKVELQTKYAEMERLAGGSL